MNHCICYGILSLCWYTSLTQNGSHLLYGIGSVINNLHLYNSLLLDAFMCKFCFKISTSAVLLQAKHLRARLAEIEQKHLFSTSCYAEDDGRNETSEGNGMSFFVLGSSNSEHTGILMFNLENAKLYNRACAFNRSKRRCLEKDLYTYN